MNAEKMKNSNLETQIAVVLEKILNMDSSIQEIKEDIKALRDRAVSREDLEKVEKRVERLEEKQAELQKEVVTAVVKLGAIIAGIGTAIGVVIQLVFTFLIK